MLTSNVRELDLNRAQYSMIADENGYAVDDAYLYRFEEERYLLVVNAGNTDKDWAHLCAAAKDYDCTLTNITADWAAVAGHGGHAGRKMPRTGFATAARARLP